ncbi:MAG TPA: SRPBCC domain-containing protein [Rhizomicrobium sp.]|nr:SRPBCC domain-containing protein [Rhizomicrobium sp.]
MADGKNELTIVRVLDAPRAKVWRACREVRALRQWWGMPIGATMRTCQVDFRIGGAMLCEIEPPGGARLWFKWIYRDIVEGESMVIELHASDASGRERDSLERPASIVRLALEDMDGQTRLTVVHSGMASETHRVEDFREGWSQSLRRLTEHLSAPPAD